MSRKFKTVYKDRIQLNICYGWDIDVQQWFIDIKLMDFEMGSNIKWFDSEKQFKKTLNNFMI
tara:strand:- start:295 stop:480 length:186 start_codon:yes stop_codon:yes gene_type:complete